jgi:hypothetical protein
MIIKKYFDFVKSFFFPLLLLSVLFVVPTSHWSGEMVYVNEDLYDVRSGFPFGFISTDFVMGNDITHGELFKLPQKMSFSSGYTTTFLLHFFLLDITIFTIVFAAIFFFVYSKFPNTQKLFRFFSIKHILLALVLCAVIVLGPFIYYSVLQGKEIPIHIAPGMYTPPSLMLPTEIPTKKP